MELVSIFFLDRFQYVFYAGSNSNLLTFVFGVPQGSVLGPLLFLIYINDVAHCSKALTFILFADDTSAFLSSISQAPLFQSMAIELSNLSNWFCANFLMLSINKSCYILFTSPRANITTSSIQPLLVNNTELKRVTNTNFFGVIPDEYLTW